MPEKYIFADEPEFCSYTYHYDERMCISIPILVLWDVGRWLEHDWQ